MGKAVLDYQAARYRLVEHIGQEVREQRVLSAMRKVPRELFVPQEYRHHAYEDRPLPIGFGQTISQPLIVAIMTEALELKGTEKTLEVGTGSGYQAAILAHLARQVITVERVEELMKRASDVLSLLGYANIKVLQAIEEPGWPQDAPYDAILVTAGAPQVPASLLQQLSVGGRLVAPVGSRYEQQLVKVTKGKDQDLTQTMGACRFVPLLGKDAWQEAIDW